jgi:hypothetical protein
VEHLFTLRHSLAAYRYYQQLIADCDREIEKQLLQFKDKVDVATKPLPRSRFSARHGTAMHPASIYEGTSTAPWAWT